jgi:hypothetical protein
MVCGFLDILEGIIVQFPPGNRIAYRHAHSLHDLVDKGAGKGLFLGLVFLISFFSRRDRPTGHPDHPVPDNPGGEAVKGYTLKAGEGLYMPPYILMVEIHIPG